MPNMIRIRPQPFLAVVAALTLLPGCSAFNTHPIGTLGTAELSPTTNLTRDLLSLPAPRGKIVTAVYGFKDQTGQYKASPDSNFSTAVTQGGASMLVKALRDSKWFIPVERENLQDVITERKIVRALDSGSDSGEGKGGVKLPSLTGAKLLIEGAVIGYDSNIKTGGLGVKYLGISGANQYRADQVTVNLRAVDTNSGQILHSVSTTKTVYSIQLTSGIYKFVSYKNLLEAEVGMTMNEPAQVAVQEAIEAAVVNLIAEGIDSRSWLLANETERNAPVLQKYRQDRLQRNEPGAGLVLARNEAETAAVSEGDGAFDRRPGTAAPAAATPSRFVPLNVPKKKKAAPSAAPLSPAFGFDEQ